jgi:hypothetical protein
VPDNWQAIEQLPSVYNRFSANLVAENADLVRSGVSRARYREAGRADMALLPRAAVATRVYILTRQQDVVFLFIKTGVTVDLLLSLDISFEVRVQAPASDPGILFWQVPVRLALPPFFSSSPAVEDRQKLAKALGQSDPAKTIYLSTGATLLAASGTADYRTARVARLEPGGAAAAVAYQRVAGSSADEVRIRYEPQTFVALLDEVARWVRGGFRDGPPVPLPLPSAPPKAAAQRLLVAVIRSWVEARRGAAPRTGHALLLAVSPTFNVAAFQGDIVLRLRPDGGLAEKPSEDSFRLRMSVQAGDDSGRALADVSLQVPDFLVEGQLHQRLLEAMLTELPLKRMFADSGLPSSQTAAFRSWLGGGAQDALVFRVDKAGDLDTDVFAFRAAWDGVSRVAIAAAMLKIQTQGDDFEVRIQDLQGSKVLLYTDLPGSQLDPSSPQLPRYLIRLVDQLSNWIHALRGSSL